MSTPMEQLELELRGARGPRGQFVPTRPGRLPDPPPREAFPRTPPQAPLSRQLGGGQWAQPMPAPEPQLRLTDMRPAAPPFVPESLRPTPRPAPDGIPDSLRRTPRPALDGIPDSLRRTPRAPQGFTLTSPPGPGTQGSLDFNAARPAGFTPPLGTQFNPSPSLAGMSAPGTSPDGLTPRPVTDWDEQGRPRTATSPEAQRAAENRARGAVELEREMGRQGARWAVSPEVPLSAGQPVSGETPPAGARPETPRLGRLARLGGASLAGFEGVDVARDLMYTPDMTTGEALARSGEGLGRLGGATAAAMGVNRLLPPVTPLPVRAGLTLAAGAFGAAAPGVVSNLTGAPLPSTEMRARRAEAGIAEPDAAQVIGEGLGSATRAVGQGLSSFADAFGAAYRGVPLTPPASRFDAVSGAAPMVQPPAATAPIEGEVLPPEAAPGAALPVVTPESIGTTVPGIRQRVGEFGEPEFFNVLPDGSSPPPLRQGTVNTVPSSFFTAQGTGLSGMAGPSRAQSPDGEDPLRQAAVDYARSPQVLEAERQRLDYSRRAEEFQRWYQMNSQDFGRPLRGRAAAAFAEQAEVMARSMLPEAFGGTAGTPRTSGSSQSLADDNWMQRELYKHQLGEVSAENAAARSETAANNAALRTGALDDRKAGRAQNWGYEPSTMPGAPGIFTDSRGRTIPMSMEELQQYQTDFTQYAAQTGVPLESFGEYVLMRRAQPPPPAPEPERNWWGDFFSQYGGA